MNTSKSSYKRLMSLVLSVLMIVAIFSVSAAADGNTCIKVNGETAADGTEYNEDAAVTIAAEDMTGVIVTVNGKAVVLDDNNGFVIAVKEGFEATETTDSPDTADDAAAKTEKVVAEDGAYQIIVTQNGDVISEVTITVKEKEDKNDSEDDGKKDSEDDGKKDSEDDGKKDSNDTPDTGDKPLVPFYGDINLDGKVTAKDALLAQRYSINLEKLNDQQKLNGNVDGKGDVTNADAMYILRYTVKLLTKFPVETQAA